MVAITSRDDALETVTVTCKSTNGRFALVFPKRATEVARRITDYERIREENIRLRVYLAVIVSPYVSFFTKLKAWAAAVNYLRYRRFV